MKKALLVLLALVVVIGAVLFFPRPQPANAANAATIAVLHGEVEVRHGEQPFGPALDGDVLASGDVVRSNPQGRAVLSFFDGSTVSVEPGSEVRVLDLVRSSGNELQVTLEQTIGRTWASITSLVAPGSKFEIKTPTSTAIVRGTAFETVVAVVNGVTVTTVRTTEGEVVVQATAGGETRVVAGAQVEIEAGERAPASSDPQPPTPRLQARAAAGVGFTVIDPRGLSCGTAGAAIVRQIPRCDVSGGLVTIGDVVAGAYTVMLTAATAVSDANVQIEAFRGSTRDGAAVLHGPLAVGDLARASVAVTVAATLGLGAFGELERITSVCGAEARGRVFSAGTVDQRTDALSAFARTSPGQPVAYVITGAELQSVMREGFEGNQGPATVSDVAVAVDATGMHLTARIGAGPISVTANGDIIVGASGGRLVLRIRTLDAGILPGAIKDQVTAALNAQFAEAGADLDMDVERVLLRSGCLGVVGTAR